MGDLSFNYRGTQSSNDTSPLSFLGDHVNLRFFIGLCALNYFQGGNEMKKGSFAIAITALGSMLLAGTVLAKEVKVDCADPKASIQKILNQAKEPTTILVKGACNETLTVEKDDIEIAGDGLLTASVVGPGGGSVIVVDGARRVVIRDIAVTGGSIGIWVKGGAGLRLERVRAHGNTAVGVLVSEASWTFLLDSVVELNEGEAGLFVGTGAQARASGTDYLNNGPGDTQGEEFGVEVQQGSYWQQGGTISGSLTGIGVFDAGRAEVREASTSGSPEAALAMRHSYIRFRKGEVHGDLTLRTDSGIILQRLNPVFADNTDCTDDESSIAVFGPPAAPFPAGTCSGF